MYSGSDSTESQKYRQWALHPSAYQNMSSDQVDWAALAQQWIIMKEAGPPPIPGETPVTVKPSIAKQPDAQSEGGEVPMDVENDKEEPHSGSDHCAPPAWVQQQIAAGMTPDWNWAGPNPNWGWGNANAWTGGVAPPPPQISKAPLLPTPNFQYTAPPESGNDNAVPFGGYSTGTAPPAAVQAATVASDFAGGYWTASGKQQQQQQQMKPHNRRYSKVNVPRQMGGGAMHTQAVQDMAISPAAAVAPPTLDAAKRKQLPAWIREGLEKMERDKLKQMEKEREKQEREEYKEKMKQTEKEKLEILKSTIKEQQKSKFESDNEYSDGEDISNVKRKPSPDPIPLTPEELMLKVRRTMTEILLNVTNRHIESICKEELDRFIKKRKASDQRTSAPSGANISAKLGLGIYGGESESSNSDESDDDDSYKNKRDSDTELKDTIRKKMADFTKTEREIEDKLAEAEAKKSAAVDAASAAQDGSPSSSDTNDNDSQVDARLQGRKATQSSTPPHRNEKSKRQRSESSSSTSSNYLTSKNHRRRSASSDSSDSHGKKRRSKSRSTDRKHKKSNRKRRSRSRSRDNKRRSRSSSRSRRRHSRSSSRSRRSRSGSYRRSSYKRSDSREQRSKERSKYKKRSRSRSRSTSSRRKSSRRRRSRSSSSSRGKRSHRH